MGGVLIGFGAVLVVGAGVVGFFTGPSHDPKLAGQCKVVACLGLAVAVLGAFL